MKAATIFHLAIGLFIISSFVSCVPMPPPDAAGGDIVYQDADEPYSREELAQMLAPIALYPDALLSQILMASTYPIEVIEADRWVENNQQLTGEAIDAALLDMDWDPSVKTLCHFPPIQGSSTYRIMIPPIFMGRGRILVICHITGPLVG